MKYSLITPKIEAQTTEIKRKIRLSMNGIVADKMTQSGLIYKQNFGVSIPRIKEIASEYSPNHDLAKHLWNLQIRETMIMASLLEPVEYFTKETAKKWIESFNQIEIIEQLTMNLFCKLSFANLLVLEWIYSTNIWTQITGFILAARITNRLSNDEINNIISKGLELSITDNLHLYKALGLCLSRLCRINKETATSILKKIEHYSDNSVISQQYISNEVKQEILFLDIL
ncbi:MAG: hypothetical protein GZ091_16205 [Paludibacter sp.]|nr:hypothetical protein [Paludibacter sp.]